MYGFLLVFFSNFVPKTHRFWDIRLVSIPWPWNPGWGSLKVIEYYTIQSGTHDFLLTFHSNHRPISHRIRDERRFPSKIARKSPFFPPPCIWRPRWRGSPWNFVAAHGSQKTRMMELSVGLKGCRIGLAVLIQYRSVTDTHPASQPASHVAVAITLNAKASSLKSNKSTSRLSRNWWQTMQSVIYSADTHTTILLTTLSSS